MVLLKNAANGTTGASIGVPAAGNLEAMTHTFYLSGTLGAGGTVQVQYSPDPWLQTAGGAGSIDNGVADASSRWFVGATLSSLTPGFITVTDIFRKVRGVVTAGDGTTSLTLEGVGP
jgi:hypothetical protein